MRHARVPDARLAVISYAGLVFLFAALLIRAHGPESLLVLTSAPLIVSAILYRRWVYLTMTGIAIAAALWAIRALAPNPIESVETLAVLAVTYICLAEAFYRLSLQRRATEQQLHWQARLVTESPNPILRISADFKVLSCNRAAAAFIPASAESSPMTIPSEWQLPVSDALRTGQQTDLEWKSGDRIFACSFVPVAEEAYLNAFIMDVTARHAAEAELRQQNEYLEALHETTLGLMNHLDQADLLEAIVNRANQLVDASFGWLYLVDPMTDTLEAKVGTGAIKPHLGTRLHRGEGLAGQVWLTGQSLVVDDYPTWSDRSLQFPQDMLRSAIGVPLKSGTEVVGVLGVSQSQTARRFGEAESEILGRFAQLASIVLENAQLYTELRRQALELTLRDQVRTALARELDLPLILRTVVEAVAQTFGYTQVSLYLLQDGMLRLQHQVGYDNVITEIPLTSGVSGRAVRTGRAILIEDATKDPDFLGAIPGVVSEVCVPLFDEGQVVGVLNVESISGVKLNEADFRLLTTVGEHVNIAIQRARLYTEVRRSEQKYRSVVENVHEVIFQVDSAGVWTYLNPAWTQITGFAVADTLGKPVLELHRPETTAMKARGVYGPC